VSRNNDDQVGYLQAELRCSRYWSTRSGEIDAEYRFKEGHRALLEVIVAEEPSIDYGTPGVRNGRGVAVDRYFPLSGPKFDDLHLDQERSRNICRGRHIGYAAAYNATMLRLLGRSNDAYWSETASPEITRRAVQ